MSNVKKLTIPSTVKKIGVRGISWCTSLESLVIEEGVERFEDYAICETGQSHYSVRIPSSINYVGKSAFLNVRFDEIELAATEVGLHQQKIVICLDMT